MRKQHATAHFGQRRRSSGVNEEGLDRQMVTLEVEVLLG